MSTLRRTSTLAASLLLLGFSILGTAEAARTDYHIDYTVRFLPDERAADVEMQVRPGSGRAKQFRFTMPTDRYENIRGKGVGIDGDKVVWKVPKSGGSLHYRYGPIDNKRSNGAFDARITDDWTILRGDDLFPSAAVTLTKGADSRTRLRFELPEDWSFVDTGYTRNRADDAFVITNPRRSFDRPVGWIIAGKVGSRREIIDGVEFAIAAPRGSSIQRNVVIALANWVLPQMRAAFGDMPPKILIVSADDPMWRGGLSSPNSFYLHSSRPLISGNYTSTLIHEMVHVVTRISDAEGDDWITEGLAEFYAVELLRRAGGMTEARYAKVRTDLIEWSEDIKTLHAKHSSGARTARATIFFQDLDAEIRKRTEDQRNLDDVTRKLLKERKVSRKQLREVAEDIAGGTLKTFDSID